MNLQAFYAQCMRGDVGGALLLLNTLKEPKAEIELLKQLYHTRFLTERKEPSCPTCDDWINQVLACYEAYFAQVLLGRSGIETEEKLAADLSALVNLPPGTALSELEDRLKTGFLERGYQFLGGKTPPFYGPYIWKTSLEERFQVTLPDRVQEVTVFFLSDFLMVSWVHFATFGRHYTGGWAKPEGLYYVNLSDQPVDTGTADFQVWFLKHEAQHLNDYARFPDLPSWQLEYRAKLVELIYHPQPKQIIEKFISQAKPDPAFPHAYAAHLITTRLALSPSKISEGAAALYAENTIELSKPAVKPPQ